MKMNLTTKILLSAAIPIVVLVLFAILSVRQVGSKMEESMLERRLQVATNALIQMYDLISDDAYHVEGEDLYLGSMDITADTSIMDTFHENTDIDVAIFYGTVRRATTVLNADGTRAVGTTLSDAAYSDLKTEGFYFADNVIVNDEPYYAYYKLLENYGAGDEVTMCVGISAESARQIYLHQLQSTIIFMVSIAIVSLVLVIIIIQGIVKGIRLSVGDLDQVAGGMLNFTVSEKLTNRGDEVGNIARAINSLMSEFIEIVHNLNGSSNSLTDFSENIRRNFAAINESITNINFAIEEIATTATTQANEAQDVADQMNEMGVAVTKASDNIGTLKMSTEVMENTNHEVSDTLDSLVTISNNTRESIEIVQRQTNDTNQSAMEIQDVVDFISDIAGQTNLLSLNASIEAARAGEQGKGFAIVANEVRLLAEQSRQAADQIEEIVRKLIDNSNSNVNAMNTVMDEIKVQHDKLDQTKAAFEHLNTEISNVIDAVDGIAEEIAVVDQAKNKVYGNLESLAAISEEYAASTQQTSATMTQISELVDECDNTVGRLGEISHSLESNVNRFTL